MELISSKKKKKSISYNFSSLWGFLYISPKENCKNHFHFIGKSKVYWKVMKFCDLTEDQSIEKP